MHAVLLEGRDLDGLRRERARAGADRWDEVWEGVIHMPPAPSMEHQRLGAELVQTLVEAVRRTGRGTVFVQANVADPVEGMNDYRIPDVAVVLNESAAEVGETYIAGGPDFVVEIRSPGDETIEKIDFYCRLGVRELLIVDRDDKGLDLYGHEAGSLVSVSSGPSVRSEVTGLTFETIVGPAGNQIRITSPKGESWTV